jgi:hypothetical protein
MLAWIAFALGALSFLLYLILVQDHAKLDTRVEVLEKEIIARVTKALEEKSQQNERAP